MSLESTLSALVQVLDEQHDLHTSLQQALQEEVSQDGRLTAGELVQVQLRKHHLAYQVEQAEHRRQEVVRELAGIWQAAPEELTISGIAQRLPEDQASGLQARKAALLERVHAIRDLAQQAARNAGARQRAVDATLAVVNEAARTHTTYSDAGRLKQQTPSFKHTAV